MSAIDEVKQKTDIVEIVSQYTSLKKAGRNLTAICPFHSEKNPSFFVYPEQQSWHCFGACNTGGDVLSFIMRKEGIDEETLEAALREHGIETIEQAEMVVLEIDGSMSVVASSATIHHMKKPLKYMKH